MYKRQQRLCIARAISLNPKLIICDEAVSALDISTQNTIIKLLNKLKKQLKLSYIFITHDLSVARLIADRILVLKKGKIVECFGKNKPDIKKGNYIQARFLCNYTIIAHFYGYNKIFAYVID